MIESHGEYNGWPLFYSLPDGFAFDGHGSPLHGYEFAIDKSPLKGGKRILVSVNKENHDLNKKELCKPVALQPEAPTQRNKQKVLIFESNSAKTVNELARAKFIQKMMNDILVDLTICEIEGWCKKEYIKQLKELINGIKV